MTKDQRTVLRQALRILGNKSGSFSRKYDQLFGVIFVSIAIDADSAELYEVRNSADKLSWEEFNGQL